MMIYDDEQQVSSQTRELMSSLIQFTDERDLQLWDDRFRKIVFDVCSAKELYGTFPEGKMINIGMGRSSK